MSAAKNSKNRMLTISPATAISAGTEHYARKGVVIVVGLAVAGSLHRHSRVKSRCSAGKAKAADGG
jgi:hypothetical protein